MRMMDSWYKFPFWPTDQGRIAPAHTAIELTSRTPGSLFGQMLHRQHRVRASGASTAFADRRVLRCWPGESFPKKVWFPQKLPHYPKAAPKLPQSETRESCPKSCPRSCPRKQPQKLSQMSGTGAQSQSSGAEGELSDADTASRSHSPAEVREGAAQVHPQFPSPAACQRLRTMLMLRSCSRRALTPRRRRGLRTGLPTGRPRPSSNRWPWHPPSSLKLLLRGKTACLSLSWMTQSCCTSS